MMFHPLRMVVLCPMLYYGLTVQIGEEFIEHPKAASIVQRWCDYLNCSVEPEIRHTTYPVHYPGDEFNYRYVSLISHTAWDRFLPTTQPLRICWDVEWSPP